MPPRSSPALLVLALAACGAPAPASPHPAEPEPEATTASQMVALLDRRRSCDDTCCLTGGTHLGGYDFFYNESAASLAEARALVKGPAPARLRAVAVRRVAVEMRPEDVALLAPLVRSEEAAGDFPYRIPDRSQGGPPACPPIDWSSGHLGASALGALRVITGGRFRTADEFDAWRAAHPDIEGSVDYWIGVLPEARRNWQRFDEMLASLRARPELLVRASLVMSWDDVPTRAEMLRLVREALTIPRLVRVLLRAETLPELEDRWALERFVARVCSLAPDLHDPTLGAALRRVWDERRFEGNDRVDGPLALAVLLLHPADARAIVEQGVDRLPLGRHDLLRAFTERHLEGHEDFLLGFFHDARPTWRDARSDILRGARAHGARAVPLLKKVALGGAVLDDDRFVLRELVDAVAAADPSATCPRRGEMMPDRPKGWQGDEAEQAKIKEIAQAARQECLRFARSWLAAH